LRAAPSRAATDRATVSVRTVRAIGSHGTKAIPWRSQPAQAQLGLLPQVLRPTEWDPPVVDVDVATLGGDDEFGRVRVERRREQLDMLADS
jgi:hypothetical protein